MLTQAEQRKAAKEFAKRWEGVGYEKGDSARFWLSLLNEVYGIDRPAEFIRFEDRVKMDHTSYIDGYIPSTHVLIEQKSMDKDLTKPIRQSDGTLLSPFQQAKRYSAELPYSERPRWIVACNFKEFFIYDMEKPSGEPEIVLLSELENDYYRMFFLVDEGDENIQKEMEVSL
ncbi:MAG: type IIL restriction-modification enzyme MmeI, partial [Tissierella sp.]|uniref:type IIL restriction-modification enzyme MmeI n=1 Tax=Tissierella sp. TaxID=41274 RepID=UPI003F9966D2